MTYTTIFGGVLKIEKTSKTNWDAPKEEEAKKLLKEYFPNLKLKE